MSKSNGICKLVYGGISIEEFINSTASIFNS